MPKINRKENKTKIQHIMHLDLIASGYYGLTYHDLEEMSELELNLLQEELEQVMVEQEAEAAAYSDHDY